MELLVQFFQLGVFRLVPNVGLALGLGGFAWRAACFCETTSWQRYQKVAARQSQSVRVPRGYCHPFSGHR